MGAKNHCVILPDADKNDALNAIIGAAFGSCGQRCMALTCVVLVGEAQEWVPEIVERAKKLKVGAGEQDLDICPMNSKQGLEKVEYLVGCGAKEAKILLDGRGAKVEGFPNGNFIGATVIDEVRPGMKCYDEEIFGPVMCIVRCDTFDDAIKLINENPYGNGTAIFTKSGAAARKF